VCPDLQFVPFGEPHHLPHAVCIACMTAAGDIAGRYKRKEQGFIPYALSYVTIDIYNFFLHLQIPYCL
jgi:hypothetical protein